VAGKVAVPLHAGQAQLAGRDHLRDAAAPARHFLAGNRRDRKAWFQGTRLHGDGKAEQENGGEQEPFHGHRVWGRGRQTACLFQPAVENGAWPVAPAPGKLSGPWRAIDRPRAPNDRPFRGDCLTPRIRYTGSQ